MAGRALQDLLALQDLDLAADQMRHRRSHLPEVAAIEATGQEAAAVGEELAQVRQAARDLEDRQKTIEAELAATEDRAGAVHRRLFGGDVSASRELQAMSAELDQLKGRASALEDSVLELMEQREPLDGRTAELEGRAADLAARRAELEDRLQEGRSDLDAQLGELAGRRADAAAAVPDPLLALYEKLRARLGGVGVARLVGNHCDGCHLTLPAVELDRVRHLGEEDVYQCEQCQRILVP